MTEQGQPEVSSLSPRDQLLSSLRQCGAPTDKGITDRLARFVKDASDDERSLIDELSRAVETMDIEDRFGVLYCAFYLARRNKAHAAMRTLAEALAIHSGDVPVSAVLRAEAMVAGRRHDQNALTRALDVAREGAKASDLAGAHYLVADICVALAEFDKREAKALLGEARKQINVALGKNANYPKYLALKAKLEGLEGNYDEAFGLIGQAMDGENPHDPDHAIRIGDYQALRLELQFRRQHESLRREQKEALEEVRFVREQVLTLMGLLAAVIAFVVGGIQIAQGSRTLAENAATLTVFGGVLLVVFGTYAALFARWTRQQTLVIGGGLMMIIVPLALIWWRSG